MDLMTAAARSMPSCLCNGLFVPVQANAVLQEVDSSTAGNRLQIVFERQADISPEALAELIEKACPGAPCLSSLLRRYAIVKQPCPYRLMRWSSVAFTLCCTCYFPLQANQHFICHAALRQARMSVTGSIEPETQTGDH